MTSCRKPGPLGLPECTLSPGDGSSTRTSSFRPGTVGRHVAIVAPDSLFEWLSPDDARDVASPQVRTENAIIDAVQTTLKSAAAGGFRYRLVRAARWPGLGGSGRYEIVRSDEARQILRNLAVHSRTLPAAKVALNEASDLLAGIHHPPGDSGLLLLRIHHARSRVGANREPALTPSQLARLRAPPDEPEQDHWISIELRWSDGTCVQGERYEITTPDGRKFEGVTNEYGRARIEGIESAGQCKIVFPRLDRDFWAAA